MAPRKAKSGSVADATGSDEGEDDILDDGQEAPQTETVLRHTHVLPTADFAFPWRNIIVNFHRFVSRPVEADMLAAMKAGGMPFTEV